MKILYFLPGTGISGGVITVCEQINRLRKRGHDVRLVTFEEKPQKISKWYPVGVDAESFFKMKELAEDWAEIIVATLYTTHFYLHLDLHTAADKYYFVQARESWFFHEGIDDYKKWQEYVEKGYAIKYYTPITVSSWLTEFLDKEYNKKAIQLKVGLNKDIFYPEPTFPRNEGKVRVLLETAGQSMPLRGIKEAQEALQGLENIEVWTMSPDDPIYAGDKHWKSPPQDMIRKIFSSCDILLKTSWYEGLGLGPMQAMATGCAVVTTDNLGCRDYVVDGQNALMVQPRNVQAISGAVERLVKDESLRNDLIKGGLETAKTFDWEPSIDLLEKEFIKRRHKKHG